MKLPLLLLLVLPAVGCTSHRSNHTLSHDMRRPGTEPVCFQVQDNDKEMNQAVRNSRRTVNTFIAAVQKPTSTQRDFQVKKPFFQSGRCEHLWLSDVTYSGGLFHGKVDNRPRHLRGLKMGDAVSADPHEITDWAFVDKGRLVGGQTIRVLFSELSPESKKDFEKTTNFKITHP